MITLTKLNEKEFVLNDDLIQTMEETPDTVITLTNGIKYVVKENCEEIKTKIIDEKKHSFLQDNLCIHKFKFPFPGNQSTTYKEKNS